MSILGAFTVIFVDIRVQICRRSQQFAVPRPPAPILYHHSAQLHRFVFLPLNRQILCFRCHLCDIYPLSTYFISVLLGNQEAWAPTPHFSTIRDLFSDGSNLQILGSPL
jgi:hypothetical protein